MVRTTDLEKKLSVIRRIKVKLGLNLMLLEISVFIQQINGRLYQSRKLIVMGIISQWKEF